MSQEIGWSVEAKLLYQIKQLTRALNSRTYISVFPNFASFPNPGITGTLYVDESTGDIYVWNGTSYVLLSSGITALNGLIAAAQTFATGTAGTDFNISSVGTTHTFNFPTASATNRGLLSSADWTTFNNKQNALTNPVTGTGTTNYVPLWTSSTALGNSQIVDNGSAGVNVGSKLTLRTDGPFATAGNISSGTNSMAIGSTGGGLLFFANNVGVGTFLSNGDFGIGKSPTTKLDVNGNALMGGSFLANNSPFITGTNISATTNMAIGTSSGALQMYSGNAERMRLTAAGDLGIGTTTPSEKLDVSGFVRSTSGMKITDGTIDFRLSWASSNRAFIGNLTNHPLSFFTNNAERVRIFNNGNIGVNTFTDAGYLMDIAGTLRSTQGANFATTSGEVLIGNLSDQGDYRLQVGGNVYVSGTQVINTGSDGLEIGVSTGNSARANFILKGTNAVGSPRISYQGINVFSTDGTLDISHGGNIAFRNGATVNATITSTGNVLIGTTTDAGYKLRVAGTVFIGDGTNANFQVYFDSARAWYFSAVGSGGNTVLRLNDATGAKQFEIYDAVNLRSSAIFEFGSVTFNGSNIGNTRIGGISPGTNGELVLVQRTGTAPTTSPADGYQLYSADVVAGNAAPHFRTENGAVVKVYQETTGVAAATRVGGGGTTVTDTDTFDGYTIAQVVRALRNQGLLA